MDEASDGGVAAAVARGKAEGIAVGTVYGAVDGTENGARIGMEMYAEVGFMQESCETWKRLLGDSAPHGFHRHFERFKMLVQQFLECDLEVEDPQPLLVKARNQYRLVCASIKIRQPFRMEEPSPIDY
eukprot:m.116159 g.116159  ORF g.116159 m.116159 type:complete len:128 (-) comp13597_c2_seq1:105-488(-)